MVSLPAGRQGGEKGENDICCKLCNSYDDCLIESVKKRVRKKHGIN
jgi:hypothetical protein